MKIKSAAVLGLLSLAAMSSAHANLLFDTYVGATAGMGGAIMFADHDHKSYVAQSYGAVAGLDIPLFRAEAEYNYLNDDMPKLHLGMINGYVKMPTTLIQPYLGAGIGAVLGGDMNDHVDIKHSAAYQGMMGVTFTLPILPFKIDGEARALYAPKFADAAGENIDLLHYDVRVKLRFIF